MPPKLVTMIKVAAEETHQHKMAFHKQQTKPLAPEHRKITSMMDNLYLDKLQGSIYDKFYQHLNAQLTDLTIRLE